MHAALTHSQSLRIFRVRLTCLARTPLTYPSFTASYFESRLSNLLAPLNHPRPKDTIRSLATTGGVRSVMARRSEEDLSRYRPGGYHPVHLGDKFNDRYIVARKLGYGQYSTVWLAQDTRLAVGPVNSQYKHICLTLSRVNRHVALKILTAESYGGGKDIYELSVLRHIKTANPDHPGYKHVACLLDEFRHEGPHGVHVCLVFEVMGEDLVALVRRYCDEKLPIQLVKQVARQLLLGLDYLHRSCKIVHTGQWFRFTNSAC